MPCRQVSTYGGKSGAGGYATEAACLEACKEGACCEDTTCSVKPQCQCQGTGKTFKGVGTTCSPTSSQCCTVCLTPAPQSSCPWCTCFCGDGLSAYPRFINITIAGSYNMWGPTVSYGFAEVWNMFGRVKQKQFSATITLSAVSGITNSSHSSNTDSRCQQWQYGNLASGGLPIGNSGMVGQVSAQANAYSTYSQAVFEVAIDYFRDTSEIGSLLEDSWASSWAGNSRATANGTGWVARGQIGFAADAGPYTSGVCLSRLVGRTFSTSAELKSINGIQE